MNMIKQAFRYIIKWILKDDLNNISSVMNNNHRNLQSQLENQNQRFDKISKSISVGVDFHEQPTGINWAVICIKGKHGGPDAVRFVQLGDIQIRDLTSYLRQFEQTENIYIDANPSATRYIKTTHKWDTKN